MAIAVPGYALELFNAVNVSDYKNPQDIEIITLSDAVYLMMKNDAARPLLTSTRPYWKPL